MSDLVYFPLTGMPLAAQLSYGPGALMLLSPKDGVGPGTAEQFATSAGLVPTDRTASTRGCGWRAWFEGDGRCRLGVDGYMVLDDLPVPWAWELLARSTSTIVLYLAPDPVQTRPQARQALQQGGCWWAAVPVLPGPQPTDGTWPAV